MRFEDLRFIGIDTELHHLLAAPQAATPPAAMSLLSVAAVSVSRGYPPNVVIQRETVATRANVRQSNTSHQLAVLFLRISFAMPSETTQKGPPDEAKNRHAHIPEVRPELQLRAQYHIRCPCTYAARRRQAHQILNCTEFGLGSLTPRGRRGIIAAQTCLCLVITCHTSHSRLGTAPPSAKEDA